MRIEKAFYPHCASSKNPFRVIYGCHLSRRVLNFILIWFCVRDGRERTSALQFRLKSLNVNVPDQWVAVNDEIKVWHANYFSSNRHLSVHLFWWCAVSCSRLINYHRAVRNDRARPDAGTAQSTQPETESIASSLDVCWTVPNAEFGNALILIWPKRRQRLVRQHYLLQSNQTNEFAFE